MFGHQPLPPKAAAQPEQVSGVLSSLTISFQFHLNRLPENLSNNSNISTSNTYSGVFGGNMLDRLLTYLYIFDVATETNAAIDRDKNGKDIVSTFKAVISGFRGDAPFSVTFTDVPALHQWLEMSHMIPNIHDNKMVINKDVSQEADVIENHTEYQRYIATHVANPLMTSLKHEVKTLHSNKRELEKQIQSLTNHVNQLKKAHQDHIDSENRVWAARHRAAMRGNWE